MAWMVYLSVLSAALLSCTEAKYEATWESLDSRPLPSWYDEAKIGIFLHWGVFSVPSYGSEWFWMQWNRKVPDYVKYMEDNYPPRFTYQDFGPMFTAEFYDPDEWANLFSAAGARYVVLTSKHHEGYTNWPSKYSFSWNAVDVGPNRDILGDLANSIRSITPHIKFGLYHSLYEWFNPLYLEDRKKFFMTQKFVDQKTLPELYEIVNKYKPEVIWSDGDWEAPDFYWKSKDFIAWLFNDSPVNETVVVNDRWGIKIPCHHGSFYTCSDKYNPGVLQPHKWENCFTLDKGSWGYNRRATALQYLSIEDLLQTIVETISCGGNALINAGPTHDGRIPPIMEERLRQMGSWLNVTGEGVYGSKPWAYQNDTLTERVWYTQSSKTRAVYAFVFDWPEENHIVLGSVNNAEKVMMLGYNKPLKIKATNNGLKVVFPHMHKVKCKWLYVLKLENVLPSPNQNLIHKLV